MKTNKHIVLTEGPIFKTLFFYSMPIIITNLVQLLFHILDVTILAVMVDDIAVTAVGACGSLVTLLVSLFTGFSTGANVLVARRKGEQSDDGVKKAIGASLSIGLVSGIILMLIGIIFAKDFLVMTNCQRDILDSATLYLITYFSGMPIIMLYNFVASVFRAMGDSKRPMWYMILSGIIKTPISALFISVFHLTVVGVALATIISNLVALVLALIVLLKNNTYCKIERKDLKIGKEELFEIIKVGVPTCFCSMFFYVANVILSATVNSISTDAMTANTISSQFDGIIYNIGCSIALATSVMIGQNYGAKNYERIKKTLNISIIYATLTSLILGIIFVIFSEQMLGTMTENQNVIAMAKNKMILLCLTYFITSIMEVYAFSLRAMQRPNATMWVGGICGLGIRGAWAWFVWPMYPTLSVVFQSYAVSAFVAVVIYVFIYYSTMKKLYLQNNI